MRSEIVLTRTIEVRCWHVVGQVAKASRREELLPVLIRARDQGSTNPSDIAEHLLFEPRSRRVVAERLLQIGVSYGLLELASDRHVLTEDGLRAIETGDVFVPELGTWVLWVSEDPLLSSPLLKVEPWTEPNAYEEVRGKEKDTERAFVKLPSWVQDLTGEELVPAAGRSRAVRIDQLEPRADGVASDSSLEVVWRVDAERLTLAGNVGGSTVDLDLETPEAAVEQIWEDLLESADLWDQWDPQLEAIRAAFDETSNGERNSMTRTLEFRSPAVSGLGSFEPTVVSMVRLSAISREDAQRWAVWRLGDRVQDYATESRFAEWRKEAADPFADFEISLPSRDEIAALAWTNQTGRPVPYAWHLAAAQDWGL